MRTAALPPPLTLFLAMAVAAPAAAQVRPSDRTRALPPVPRVDGPLALRVVYPPAGSQLTASDSAFVLGSTGSGAASLTVNGLPVSVAPNGAFLAWVPLPDDSVAVLRLLAVRGADTAVLDHRVRLPARFLPPATRLWIDAPSLEPRGARWVEPGEWVRVAVRAAPGASVSVRLPDGRTYPLPPDTGASVQYGPFDLRPARAVIRSAARYVGIIPATALGAALPAPTVAQAWPARRDSAGQATVIAVLGSDTARAGWPLRLAILEPPDRPVVVLDDDSARTGNTDGAVVGRPAPDATYHWFFANGTRAVVSGRAGDELRLRLSRASSAWVGLADVGATLPPGTPPPASRVALVRLVPGDSSVRVRIALSARLPFRVDEEDRAITVRLYGAQGDLDFIQYGGTDALVRRITWAQPAEDECSISFELGARVFGWRARWENTDLVLEIRRPPVIRAARPLEGRTIAVDPGHPPLGATGPTGLLEAEANLAVAVKLREILERAGARVIMTRTSDSAIGLYERTRAAEAAGADVLVSIHNNALPDGVNPFENHGTSTYYFHPRSVSLARAVQDAMVHEMGLRNLGIGRANFALARPTWMPAILTEGAFMMIPEQENALRTPSFQEAYARGIALGLQAFFQGLARDAP